MLLYISEQVKVFFNPTYPSHNTRHLRRFLFFFYIKIIIYYLHVSATRVQYNIIEYCYKINRFRALNRFPPKVKKNFPIFLLVSRSLSTAYNCTHIRYRHMGIRFWSGLIALLDDNREKH